MSRHPHRPGSHDGRLEIGLDLIGVIRKGFSFHQVEVTKEHATKDGVPDGLINKDLGSDRLGGGTGQLGVEESVKVVSRGTVQEETKGTETNGSHEIVGLVAGFNELLRQDVSGRESGEGSESLGKEGLCF